MITLNLSAPLEDLTGKPHPDTMGKALAASLANATEGDPLKCWHWSRDLYRTGIIEVDAADFETIKEHAKTSQRMPNWAKGQVIEALLAAVAPTK